jgi:excisionase family DNA binding protein
MTETSDTPLFTLKEAASYLRIGRTSLYRLIKDGHIETVKVLKRKQLIEQKVLDQFVSNPTFQKTNGNNNDN